jgi:hypothetical protein
MNGARRDDSGVATILVILAMTAILIGAALAIDVGGYVATARSAQSSADGTVLALAMDCAVEGAPVGGYEVYRKDGQTIDDPACRTALDAACPEYATVTVTDDVDGLLLVQSAGDVDRSATACWGTLGDANTVPLVISDCEFVEPSKGTLITLYLDDPKPQGRCLDLPGGFSQLNRTDCSVPISAGGIADGIFGGGGLQSKEDCLIHPPPEAPLPRTILIPIYDAKDCKENCSPSSLPFLIKGFAALEVTGYSFNGNVFGGSLGKKCPDEKDRGKYCIEGVFVEFVGFDGTPGPSGDFGVSVVYLYK